MYRDSSLQAQIEAKERGVEALLEQLPPRTFHLFPILEAARLSRAHDAAKAARVEWEASEGAARRYDAALAAETEALAASLPNAARAREEALRVPDELPTGRPRRWWKDQIRLALSWVGIGNHAWVRRRAREQALVLARGAGDDVALEDGDLGEVRVCLRARGAPFALTIRPLGHALFTDAGRAKVSLATRVAPALGEAFMCFEDGIPRATPGVSRSAPEEAEWLLPAVVPHAGRMPPKAMLHVSRGHASVSWRQSQLTEPVLKAAIDLLISLRTMAPPPWVRELGRTDNTPD